MSISQFLRAIIIGAPGSGKGTIANRIVKDFHVEHLSSGDLLRRQIDLKTAVGLEAQTFIEKGSLVPDDVMVDLMSAELAKVTDNNWLLDGFPRTLPQAAALYNRHPVDVVVYLHVPFQVIIDRIKGRSHHPGSGRIYHTEFNPPKVPGRDDLTNEPLVQRDDDHPEAVETRLISFESQTQPVIEYYRALGLLAEFKGSFSNLLWPRVHGRLTALKEARDYTHYT